MILVKLQGSSDDPFLNPEMVVEFSSIEEFEERFVGDWGFRKRKTAAGPIYIKVNAGITLKLGKSASRRFPVQKYLVATIINPIHHDQLILVV